MSTVPHSELVARAVAYVAESRKDFPEKALSRVLDEASMRFNLSPLEAMHLQRVFSPEKNETDSKDTSR